MSATATETTTTINAVIRFTTPDNSITAQDRSLFSLPPNKETVEHKLDLHDYRAADLPKGQEGLDANGFTYVEHQSALAKDYHSWFDGNNLEEVYFPEVCELIKKITGAKKAIVNNAAFRRKFAEKTEDPKFYIKRGDPMDHKYASMKSDRAMAVGKDADSSLEPLRTAHLDLSTTGLKRTGRTARKDICAISQVAIDAEDKVAHGEKGVKVPRYASYSVWRPLKPVQRDGLAVLDWKTLDKSELCAFEYRYPSTKAEAGEYTVEAYAVTPPKKPEAQRWYTMPGQRPEDVLIIKLADTASEDDPDISGGCGHCSPLVEGQAKAEPRESVECRVLVFWE